MVNIRHLSIDKFKSMCPSKRIILTVCAVLMCCMIVGGSIAWLTSEVLDVTNKFDPAKVVITVDEEFNGEIKSNVRIENIGNVHAYIRVALVPAWVDENGNIAAQQASLEDCTITWGEGGTDTLDGNPDWIEGSDGFYYCTKPIPPKSNEPDTPDNHTPILIKECKVKPKVLENGMPVPHEYDFELSVIASAVQAIPTSAVTEAWGVRVDNNGNLIVPKKPEQGGN